MAAAESKPNAPLSAASKKASPIDRILEEGNGSAESVGQLGSHQNLEAHNDSNWSESSLRRIIDTIPALAWCARPNGSMEFLNKQWHDYTGLAPKETVGWGYQVAFHPEDRKSGGEKCRELFSANGPAVSKIRLRRYDGTYRSFLIRVEPLRDDAGQIIRWYGTSTDMKLSSKPRRS